MRLLPRFRPALAAAALAAASLPLLAPSPAKAWWGPRFGVVIAGPPVYYAPPPVYYRAPAYYAPAPYYYHPRHVWVRAHWHGPYWVPGHWSY